MPKYRITFNLEGLCPEKAYIETEGVLTFTVYLTTPKPLTSDQEAKIKQRLPFVDITLVS